MAEERDLTGPTGDAGSGEQTFSYDALDRLTGSAGLAAPDQTYAYDRDGNRVAKTIGTDSYLAAYDRTGALVSVPPGPGVRGSPAQRTR